MKISKKTA